MSEEAVAQALLGAMGVEKYEPGVASVVLEHMHRSVQSILAEAREAALHAQRDTLQVQDLELVEDLAEDGYCASPLPTREAMFDLARRCNAKPLRIPDGHGLRLPPSDSLLTAQCYQLTPRDAESSQFHPAPASSPAAASSAAGGSSNPASASTAPPTAGAGGGGAAPATYGGGGPM
eukprot:CAMPEP_0198667908 /NCGR_PEP_ID=MMETSP1467-20131203/70428_1 /TAXON_ID=1462469 /ORGANISM="unid. sp., Strain CCMP2135" /LENGTH=176 /DNA_ID=CAMNT_0044404619 /DNA_START=30 /DNA_END=560 /DNA_ORIENTATION=-